MPQARLSQIERVAIMQEIGIAADGFCQAYAPQRCCAPFAACGAGFWAVVCQTLAHDMQQHVGLRPDQLETLLWLIL